MKLERLEKYKRGNFVLTDKHIYIQNKLVKIRDHIIKRKLFGLTGGADTTIKSAKQGAKDYLEEKFDNYNVMDEKQINDEKIFDNYNELEQTLKQQMQKSGQLLIKDGDDALKDLLKADEELINEFKKFNELAGSSYEGIPNAIGVKRELLKIQKSLFNLQVKLIFSQLRKVKSVDVAPLFATISKKIEAMNEFIEAQEKALEAPENDNQQDNPPISKSIPEQVVKQTMMSRASNAASTAASNFTSTFTGSKKKDSSTTTPEPAPRRTLSELGKDFSPTPRVEQKTTVESTPEPTQIKELTGQQFLDKINSLTFNKNSEEKEDLEKILSENQDLRNYISKNNLDIDNPLELGSAQRLLKKKKLI
uniref:Uncharacterized protein n=1 Tax=viral metagenome TaxID=1070528 RepID=A0A6C0D933_9ZZZZ